MYRLCINCDTRYINFIGSYGDSVPQLKPGILVRELRSKLVNMIDAQLQNVFLIFCFSSSTISISKIMFQFVMMNVIIAKR